MTGVWSVLSMPAAPAVVLQSGGRNGPAENFVAGPKMPVRSFVVTPMQASSGAVGPAGSGGSGCRSTVTDRRFGVDIACGGILLSGGR